MILDSVERAAVIRLIEAGELPRVSLLSKLVQKGAIIRTPAGFQATVSLAEMRAPENHPAILGRMEE